MTLNISLRAANESDRGRVAAVTEDFMRIGLCRDSIGNSDLRFFPLLHSE